MNRTRFRTLSVIFVVCVVAIAPSLFGALTAEAQPRALRVSIVGDSFAAGVGAGSATAGYAHRVGARGCWDVNVVAKSGSGYAASTDPFVSVPRIAAVAAARPDVIIVQGSGNDRGDAGLYAAAAGLYVAYRLVAPQARIIVVGPTGAPNARHGNIDEIRRHLRDASGIVGATFLDPRAERWLDFSTDYVSDGIHPNDKGHARMATRLFDAMSAMGIPGVNGCR